MVVQAAGFVAEELIAMTNAEAATPPPLSTKLTHMRPANRISGAAVAIMALVFSALCEHYHRLSSGGWAKMISPSGVMPLRNLNRSLSVERTRVVFLGDDGLIGLHGFV